MMTMLSGLILEETGPVCGTIGEDYLRKDVWEESLNCIVYRVKSSVKAWAVFNLVQRTAKAPVAECYINLVCADPMSAGSGRTLLLSLEVFCFERHYYKMRLSSILSKLSYYFLTLQYQLVTSPEHSNKASETLHPLANEVKATMKGIRRNVDPVRHLVKNGQQSVIKNLACLLRMGFAPDRVCTGRMKRATPHEVEKAVVTYLSGGKEASELVTCMTNGILMVKDLKEEKLVYADPRAALRHPFVTDEGMIPPGRVSGPRTRRISSNFEGSLVEVDPMFSRNFIDESYVRRRPPLTQTEAFPGGMSRSPLSETRGQTSHGSRKRVAAKTAIAKKPSPSARTSTAPATGLTSRKPSPSALTYASREWIARRSSRKSPPSPMTSTPRVWATGPSARKSPPSSITPTSRESTARRSPRLSKSPQRFDARW